MDSDANSEQPVPYSRFLFKRPGFYRTFTRGDKTGVRYDASSLPFLVEEMLATAVIEIGVTSTSPAYKHLDELVPQLRERITVLDQDAKVAKEVHGILAPVTDEFRITQRDQQSLRAPSDLNPAVGAALTVIVPALYDFLLGARHRLQIDVDVQRFRKAVDELRAICESPEARANLAVLAGALVTYRPLSIPSIALRSMATEEQIRRFQAFVEDVTYRELSRDAGLLGIPEDGERAVTLMKRHLKRLSEKPLLSQLFKIGAKWVSSASSFPEADAELVRALIPSSYMPPIVPIGEAFARAVRQWKAARRPMNQSPAYADLASEGWVEVEDTPQPTAEFFQGRSEGEFE